jgi:FKBP-type peptidyl-prolyl cis-trans isomerase
MKPRLRRLSLFLLTALAVCSGPRARAQRERLPPEDLDIVEKRWPNAKRTFTCLRYVVLKPGDTKGPTPAPGMIVKALFKGMLLNGKVFDQALDPKHPLTMRVGRGVLIAGWDEALQKMHRGEKWILIVPSELAYGYRGREPDIPPQATLVFEIELLDFSSG